MSLHLSNPAGEWAGYSCSLGDICVTVMKDPLETHIPV